MGDCQQKHEQVAPDKRLCGPRLPTCSQSIIGAFRYRHLESSHSLRYHADSKGLCIVARTTRPSAHRLHLEIADTASLSFATKMLSIGLTVCGTPFAMRRKPTLAKQKFLSRFPCSLFLPLNKIQRISAPAAACRGVPICFLYTPPSPHHVAPTPPGMGTRSAPLPFPTPFTCLSWCRRHLFPSAGQCCLR